MAVQLSLQQMIVLVLGFIALFFGIAFLAKVSMVKSVLENIPGFIEKGESRFLVETSPERSQSGTLFFIRARLLGRVEEQQIFLKIEHPQYSSYLELFDDGFHYDSKASDSIYGGFFDSSKKPLGEYNISAGGKNLASFLVYKPGCAAILGKQQEENINFVLLPSGYKDYEDFKADARAIVSGKNSLLTIEPFYSEREKFSFTLINTTEDFECKQECSGPGSTTVCCNNQKVIEEASQCQYDQIVVLLPSDNLCGSASTYAKVCAKHELAKLILVHELGHSFSDLSDEYIYANNVELEEEKVNCALSGCEKWKNVTEGCYQGCGSSSLYRSVEKDSIMYSYTPIFNEVSKRQIETIIGKYSASSIKGEQNTPKASYVVPLSYEKGNISVAEVYTKPIAPPLEAKDSFYKAEMYDSAGKVIFHTALNLPIIIESLPNTGDAPRKVDSFNHSLLLPYYSNAVKLTLFEKNEALTSVFLSSLARQCGNNICDQGENHRSCSLDCSLEADNFCEISTCDPNCPSQANCTQKRAWLKGSAVFLILTAIIMIGIIFYRIRKKNS